MKAATIIIPCFNHADHLGAAIDSALAQTAPCQVIVVNDGSTDNTVDVMGRYGDRILALSIPHAGVCTARNVGLDHATAEFVQFLDADDSLAPDKIQRQVAELDAHPECGWVLCDVAIDDNGKHTTASARYDYAHRQMSGWIQPQLLAGNFIPISSPLVRRSVISDLVRFHDHLVPEDWHFWCAVAGLARVRYLPRIMAKYYRRRTGRATTHFSARRTAWPKSAGPLRLNLACGVPNTESWHPIAGFVNLDKSLGWKFQDGFGEFATGTVAAITESHGLMYAPETDWPAFLRECYRVLAPGGVLRITEDDTVHPDSPRRGGWRGSDPFVSLTDPEKMRRYVEAAGFTVYDVGPNSSRYVDRSLIQANHGEPPAVFHVEGVKQSCVLFTPHNDDETLFAAFTVLRYRPRVVVCFPSTGDYGDPAVREAETREAMEILGGFPVDQWDGGDLVARMRAIDRTARPLRVWAPDRDASHPDHVAVAEAAAKVFGDRVATFHTYNERGKVRHGSRVVPPPEWIGQKLRALARYQSQINHPRAHAFFLDDLHEYLGTP